MIYCLLLLMAKLAWAEDPSWRWSTAFDIVEKHEFYSSNEVISKPENTWQVLFAVMYSDASLKPMKDCVLYKVPGAELGKLKVIKADIDGKCEIYLHSNSQEEWKNIKALQYSFSEDKLSLFFTNKDFSTDSWIIPLFNIHKKTEVKMLSSSVESRSPKIIFLAPQKDNVRTINLAASGMKDGETCHKISDDCQELTPANCHQCQNGWYEVPNGCKQGPKYCGVLNCGKKNGPACRRGINYQGLQKKYNCRTDSSFAYCMEGLEVQCQGSEAYCN